MLLTKRGLEVKLLCQLIFLTDIFFPLIGITRSQQNSIDNSFCDSQKTWWMNNG